MGFVCEPGKVSTVRCKRDKTLPRPVAGARRVCISFLVSPYRARLGDSSTMLYHFGLDECPLLHAHRMCQQEHIPIPAVFCEQEYHIGKLPNLTYHRPSQ